MKLFRLCAHQVQLSEPLPWNVYNVSGQLLLSAGYQLQDAQQLEALVSRGVYADEVAYAASEARRPNRPANDPFAHWADIHKRVEALLLRPIDPLSFAQDVDSVASDIGLAIDQQLDHSLFDVLHGDDPKSYAVTHSVQTAFVASLVSSRLGWSESQRQVLANAALTMNLGMRELQSKLAMQLGPLSSAQREQVARHPSQGRALLERAGISDIDWLQAVEQHHITPDGSGLPAHHHQLSELACMLHYSDVYLAKISARASRPAIPAHLAARGLYLQAEGARNPYVAAIIKEIGVYPPGSSVRLANGEVAIVIQRGEVAHMPWVRSLLDNAGQPLPDPVVRDTSRDIFKVLEALPRGRIRLSLDQRRRYARDA